MVAQARRRRGRIETRRWFVEKDEVGIADQGEREVESAQLTPGKRSDARARLLGEPDQVEHVLRCPRLRIVTGEKTEHLADPQPRVDGGPLEDDSDFCAECAPGVRRVDAEDRDLARVAIAVAFEDLDGCRLAGAVWPEQRKDLSLGDGQVDTPEHLARSIGFA